jgi:2-polyprenyl-3-methyl-5-hydroxy-6-metoxy-1,4-benzoquinol methylase
MSSILESWEANAESWSAIIGAEGIESRKLVTNQAILQTILSSGAARVLDAGCGEGWLCRALQSHGVEACGVDGTGSLIDKAKALGTRAVSVMRFEDMVMETLPFAVDFDGVVFNFCLYEDQLTRALMQAAIHWVKPGGLLFIQTLHPAFASDTESYADGWRQENWAGLGHRFSHPYPWYFRTVSNWVNLLVESGWRILQLQEPIHPITQKPASLLLKASS